MLTENAYVLGYTSDQSWSLTYVRTHNRHFRMALMFIGRNRNVTPKAYLSCEPKASQEALII